MSRTVALPDWALEALFEGRPHCWCGTPATRAPSDRPAFYCDAHGKGPGVGDLAFAPAVREALKALKGGG